MNSMGITGDMDPLAGNPYLEGLKGDLQALFENACKAAKEQQREIVRLTEELNRMKLETENQRQTAEELTKMQNERVEDRKKMKEMNQLVDNLSRQLKDEYVPLKVLTDGFKKRARLHGLSHAAVLFDDLNNMLIRVPAWVNSVEKLEGFFEEEEEKRQEEKTQPTKIENNYNAPVGQAIGRVGRIEK